MKKFIAQNGSEYHKLLIMLFSMIIAVLLIVQFYGKGFLLLIIALVLSLLFVLFLNFVKKFGLYIENDQLLFKSFMKKPINIENVAGLLILKSQIHTKYGAKYIKNRDGNYEYSIIYLKEVRPDFADYNRGCMDFLFTHNEYVHFYTVYDEEVIGLFKGKVPIITCK